MECNKEEALRAKEMAEKKMESKDFVSAKKVAQKAYKLYPDLKDISQMILVCDVHCAAQNKVYGNENDWYGILQVDQTADETAIKKQYRKLALLLHPDKNKLPGASDAFKFVGEAQKVLLDCEKRMMYDRKCNASGRYPVSNWTVQQGSRQSNSRGVHSWFHKPFPGNPTQFMNQQHQQHNQPAQSGSTNGRPTFWTVCPFCSVRYQYYKELVNKTLFCQNCKKSFAGYEMNAPSGTSGINLSQPTYSQQGEGVSQNYSTAVPQNTSKKSSRSENQERINSESLREKKFSSERVLKKKRKKRNKLEESSGSSDSESSTDDREDMNIEEDGDNVLRQNFGYNREQNLRRSARSRQQVSYDENLSSDDDLVKPLKRSRSSGSFSAVKFEGHMVHEQAGLAPDMVENWKDVKHYENSAKRDLQNGQKEAEKSYEKVSISKDKEKSFTPEMYEYPDPDFSDFDKERKEECFATGQIWAIYDTLDAMPRYYALVRKVHSLGFKLQITWLEPIPDDKDEIKWVNEGLPVSCGKFRQGSSENCEDHAMFSHLACWEKGSRRNNYKIYPRKGETWAIFKDWDINWHSDPQRQNKYEFEFVEVLSNYIDNIGVQVAYLGKLKDFACLFCRTRKDGMDSVLVPVKQMFRFSHKVPSVRMTGMEGKNVPAGSFELDPASLPSSCARVDVSKNLDSVTGQSHLNGSSSRLAKDILERKNESKDGASPTQFGEDKVKSEKKDSFVDKVNLKDNASQTHSQNAGSRGNATTLPDVVEPIIVSDDSETSADEIGFKVKFERNSPLGQAGEGVCQKSRCSGSDSFTNGIVGTPISALEDYVVPEPEFYDFDGDKSLQRFKVGQIWALYGDEDALPKYYGRIQKITCSSGMQLHLKWLASCCPSKDMITWKDKRMPICCGKFKLGKRHKYDSLGVFSHQVKVESADEKDVYCIFPQTGDVWALYKDWSAEIKCSELENCQYDIVEVQAKNDLGITVRVLEQVDGFKSVFKPQMEGRSTMTMEIPLAELLRFSHQIPAFRLTEEKDGSLRGFLELDPAAMPLYYFCLS